MPLRPEDIVHQEIMEKLEKVGWLNGNKTFNIPENTLIEGDYLPKILEKKLRR